jgi:hypothetical protein
VKIEKIRSDFEQTSDTLSQLVRQLAFARIAVIWILRVGEKTGNIPYSDVLFTPLRMFVIGLILDVSQYALKTFILWAANTYFWLKHKDEKKDVTLSGWWNLPAYGCFIAKTIFVLLGYYQLLIFMNSQLHPKG